MIAAGFIRESDPKDQPAATVTKPDSGIAVQHWFWAAVEAMTAYLVKNEAPKPVSSGIVPTSADAQTVIGQLLIDNPDMNAGAFYNLLKSKGWEMIPPTTVVEADASSAQPAALMAGVNPLKKPKESDVPRGTMSFRARFLEATPRGDDNKHGLSFQCVLLQEGLGNLKDAYYYSKEALVSAVPVFEGKKIYADHPSAEEEQIRPERSVRDILGHFEQVSVEENDQGSRLVGKVRIMPDNSFEWARALMREAVEFSKKYPDKDFVGLSINAGGDAQEADIDDVIKAAPAQSIQKLNEAKAQGITKVKKVSSITEAVSCDLVTEAGAGGRIVTMLESDQPSKETESMKVKTKEAEGEQPVDKKEGEAPAAPHSDEQQDMELIKKMLKDHLGGDEHDEATVQAACEAVKCAQEVGAQGEQAYQNAGMMMKMAQHMKNKKQAEPPKDESPKDDHGDVEKESAAAPVEAEAKEAEIIKLKGENAKLKESLNLIEVEKYLDKVLKESGERNEVTKAFRESLGEKLPKSKEEIDSKFKLFMEGAKAAGRAKSLGDLFVQPEKTGEVARSADFSDCLN